VAVNPKEVVDAVKDIATNAVEKASDIVENASDIIRGDLKGGVSGIVENSIDGGGAIGAERKIKAVHEESADGRCGWNGMAAMDGLGQIGGVGHGHHFVDREILSQHGGVNYQAVEDEVANPVGGFLADAAGAKGTGDCALGGEVLREVALGMAGELEQGTGRKILG